MPFAAFFVAVCLLLCIPDRTRKALLCLLLGAAAGLAAARHTNARLEQTLEKYAGQTVALTAEVESVSASYYPGIVDAVLRVAAIFLCLTVHETCHGLAALALGDPTAKSMHRLSLNPLHHIDWLGLALMFTVGFGWAKPVPVNPNYFRKPKQGMAVTALAGPVSNLILAVLFLGIGKVIYLYAPYSAGMNVFFEWCLFTVAPMSVGMGLFNLIPIPPLDGSKVLAMFLPNSAYGQLMRYERYGILVLLALSWLGLGGNFLGNAIYGVYEALFHIFFA